MHLWVTESIKLPDIAKVVLVKQRVVYPGPIVVQACATHFRSEIEQEAKEAIQSDC